MVKCPACQGRSAQEGSTATCNSCKGAFPDFLVCHRFVKRQTRNSRFSHYEGTWEQLELLVAQLMHRAQPGYKDGVLVVPIDMVDGFFCGVVEVTAETQIVATLETRRQGEEPYINVTARSAAKLQAKAVEVVVYRHDVLAADNDATAETCYEIVSINARPTEEPEPIHPVTMMRNMLHRPGGTATPHTAEQFAESILYWSTHAMIASPQRMFVVTAYYGSGHGDSLNTFLVTPNFAEALATIGNRSLGYQAKFHGMEHGISIDLLEVGKAYERREFKSNDGCPVPDDYPCVAFFRYRDGGFQAEWRPSVLKRLGLTLPDEYFVGSFQIPEK